MAKSTSRRSGSKKKPARAAPTRKASRGKVAAPAKSTVSAKSAVSAKPVASGKRMWRQGVLLQLANPKAILFFTALLPQFVDPAHAIAPQIGVLAVTSIVSEFVVLAGYAWLAARGGALLVARPRLARATDAAAGTCLIGAGLGLAFAHR